MTEYYNKCDLTNYEVFLLRFLLVYFIGKFDVELRINSKEETKRKRWIFCEILPRLKKSPIIFELRDLQFIKEEIIPICCPVPNTRRRHIPDQSGKDYILTHFPDKDICSLNQKLQKAINSMND